MEKKTLERLREIGAIVGRNWRTADGRVVQAAARELERLDAERRKDAVGVFVNVNRGNGLSPCWEHTIDEAYDGVDFIHLFKSPTIPEGWLPNGDDQIPNCVCKAGYNKLKSLGIDVDYYEISEALRAMLAAAQGEHNAN